MSRKEQQRGGVKLTAKTARTLAMQEFGTARGLTKSTSFVGAYFMEFGNLRIEICADAACIAVRVVLAHGTGSSVKYFDPDTLQENFKATGKQREKILFRHERLPEHLNVEDVAAGDKLVREYETTFINGGLRLKPLKTNNGVTFIRSLYLSPLEDVIDMVQFYERTTPQGGSYIVAKAGFLTAAVIMPYAISKKFADELEELSYQCRHFLNTRSVFTTPAAEDEEEPDENQTTTFDTEAAEVQE